MGQNAITQVCIRLQLQKKVNDMHKIYLKTNHQSLMAVNISAESLNGLVQLLYDVCLLVHTLLLSPSLFCCLPPLKVCSTLSTTVALSAFAFLAAWGNAVLVCCVPGCYDRPFLFLSLVLLCFPFISLLAECLIPASCNSLTLFYPDTFRANHSFPRIFSTEYSLVLLNLLSPSLTFHSLCHAFHNKHI